MKQIIFNIVLMFLLGLLTPSLICAQDAQLIVVGNNVSVPSEMDFKQLKSVLRGEKMRWNDGKQVIIALMKSNTPVGKETCTRIYNMSPNELNKYFLALVFQGRIKAPTFFTSPSELNAFVAETPGAIGVVDSTHDLTLKIITIDGETKL
ncbi:hypothetical protein [Maribacter arcticus]|uniref:PBP superfamily domain-containing protein n=1 Tax=Maribacter arcticus TaxID=561365 RepID=A0A1T5D689_9FLAO|nr:hypothetical protein [Maribacter arcticus]SKB67252.1 hypothetical protein SAMN05660866_02765 [Maribacter arcticus]